MSGPRIERLADLLERTISGPMWHGPSLAEVLNDVNAEQAAARPIAGAHSIFELVRHIWFWSDTASARLMSIDPIRERFANLIDRHSGREVPLAQGSQDWQPLADTSDASWQTSVHSMKGSYRDLAKLTRMLGDAALDEDVPGSSDTIYTVYEMLHGVVEHGCYHGGQIVLLKKAIGA
jgi:hypothetical protein